MHCTGFTDLLEGREDVATSSSSEEGEERHEGRCSGRRTGQILRTSTAMAASFMPCLGQCLGSAQDEAGTHHFECDVVRT